MMHTGGGYDNAETQDGVMIVMLNMNEVQKTQAFVCFMS